MTEAKDSVPILNTIVHSAPIRDSRVFTAVVPSSGFTGILLLGIALVSGISLMVPMLTAGPVELDEYGTYWIADDSGPLTLCQRSLDYENIPPLSPWFHRLFMDIFGKSEWSFRLPSAIWFVLAIGVSYLFGNELRGAIHGGLCAILTAWHPTALGEIQLARCYSLSLLLSAICFWAAVRWMKRPAELTWAILWCVSAVGLTWTHYLNVAVIGATFLVLVWRMYTRSFRGFVFLMISVLSLILCCTPLTVSYLRMAGWGKHFGFQTDVAVLEVISPMWWLGLPAGWCAGRILDRFSQQPADSPRVQSTRVSFVVLFLWGGLPILGALFIRDGELASLANPRYRIGFDVAAGCLLVTLMTQQIGTRASLASVVVAIIASWSVADRLPWEPKRLNTPQAVQWRDLALHIEQNGTSGEPIFVQSGLGEGFLIPSLYEDTVFMDYAACRLGRFYLQAEHPRYALPFRWDHGIALRVWFRQRLEEIRESDRPVLWVVSATDTDLNRLSLKYFQEMAVVVKFEATDRVDLPDVTLIRFEAIE
ncbi:MAG: glycosyltransferase family 39 protein [Planctomyces sp.]|nr:glycosyltransferase family 39 protein [Planctomyces sp.]